MKDLSLTQVLRDTEGEIPVIAYDRLIMKSKAVLYYVSFDNYRVDVLHGQFVRDSLNLDNPNGKKYNIEFTAGDPANNTVFRWSFRYPEALYQQRSFDCSVRAYRVSAGRHRELESFSCSRKNT